MKLLGACLAALVALATCSVAAATTSLTLEVTASPHFSAAAGACPASHVAATVSGAGGATLGELDGCFQSFAVLSDGSDAFTATYTFDIAGGRIITVVAGQETPTATGLVQTVTGTILGGTGRYADATGTINGGGPIDFTTGEPRPDLTFVLSFSSWERR